VALPIRTGDREKIRRAVVLWAALLDHGQGGGTAACVWLARTVHKYAYAASIAHVQS